MSPERAEKGAAWKTSEVLIPESYVEQFLDLPENRGFKLYSLEFDKISTRILPNGTSKRTQYPVSISPVAWVDKTDIRFDKNNLESGVHKYYLLAGKKHGYFIEFNFFSHYDSDVFFTGITKVPNPRSVNDKEKWKTIALYSRIRPVYFEPNETRQAPSVGITFTGGRNVRIEVAGEEKDLAIESFYRKLTRNITT